MKPFFSKTKGHLFLAAIIESYWKQIDCGYLGRTWMQKAPYFVKDAGVPMPFRYEILHYGPYSSEVSSCLEELIVDGIIKDESQDMEKYSNYKITSLGRKYIEKNKAILRPHQDTIDNVVGIFKKIGPEPLELISTLHFIFQEQSVINNRNLKQRVIDRFIEIKKEKFERNVISHAYNVIQRAGLFRIVTN